ncbi:GL22279 [Drosophila persimilis]|uniref:GL22279 n=1 Tax=Drosophila persimilis TaxID=7234 RepID=B4GFU9_DROPE|nr:GL22279 [Drosophila persimilis]
MFPLDPTMPRGLRAIKRDINYAAVVLCGSFECMKFLQTSGIEFVDTSRCLHLDEYYMAHRNYNLADSMKILRQRIIDVEEFIQNRGTKFISSLGKNLTETIDNQLKDYLRMIIREAKTKIGRCKPLTYIYDRGLDLVCKRMVDPINGYWISVSVAAFLLLPVLFIAHRLQCLFKQHRLIRIRAIRAIRPRVEESDDENPCPYCNAGANRIPGGNVVCIGLDDAETTIFDEQNTIEETLNINDADRKNKVD